MFAVFIDQPFMKVSSVKIKMLMNTYGTATSQITDVTECFVLAGCEAYNYSVLVP